MCAAAFRQRNFDSAGVANRNMGIGYSMKVLEHFYEDPDGKRAALARRATELTRAISIETAGFLEDAANMVERIGTRDVDRISRETALLGLRIASADRERHMALDELYADMEAFGARAVRPRVTEVVSRKAWQLAQSVALSASLAMWGTACSSCGSTMQPADPVPGDNLRPPPPPPPDPVPVDQPIAPDPLPADHPMVVDPPPPPGDQLQQQQLHEQRHRQLRQRRYPPPPDPVPPPPPPVCDPLPTSRSYVLPSDDAPVAARQTRRSLELIDKWRDTTARHATRSADLALCDPLFVVLRARREGDVVRVVLAGGPASISWRWDTDGSIEGDGREILWRPASAADQLSVAVRSEGGVAITSLRAREV